jgi:hypothetical protein
MLLTALSHPTSDGQHEWGYAWERAKDANKSLEADVCPVGRACFTNAAHRDG